MMDSTQPRLVGTIEMEPVSSWNKDSLISIGLLGSLFLKWHLVGGFVAGGGSGGGWARSGLVE